MKYKYMYIDERGDLGFDQKSSKFLVISALMIDDYRELDRIIKNMRRNKFKKELAKMSELKAYKLYDYIKIFMLYKFIAGKLAKNILMNDIDVDIKIDKSKGNMFLQKDFNDYFKARLKEG